MTTTVSTDTANKRQRPGDDSPPKRAQKKSKGKIAEGTACCICEDIIKIENETNDGDDALFCEGFCLAWAHRKCMGLSKQLYKIIFKSDDPFLCSYCSLAFYQKEITNLSERVNSLTLEITHLKSVGPAPTTVNSEVIHTSDSNRTNSVDRTSTIQPCTITNQSSISPPQDISKIITSVLSEEKERDKRRLNLIIHNLKESHESDPQKRKEVDINESTKLFQNYLGAQVSISNASRIGKKCDNTNKPRLLKVTVSSSREKVQVLRNCTKLRSKDNPEEIQSVYITPDLTPKEQKENKALRSQLAELNKSEKLYKIKNGKIVRRQV